MKYKYNYLNDLIIQIRRDVIRMVYFANSGHPGGSLGCVEFLVALFKVVMNYSTDFNIKGLNEDLFFLSNGHICPSYYSILARSGFFNIDELSTFRKINSRLQGHPTNHSGLPGIRISTGSLGQGLSVGIGAAIAKKMDKDNSIIYTLHGDGELQEGQMWEAFMYAGSNKLDNIIATIDYNNCQIDGFTDDVLSLGDLKSKLESFNWNVIEEKQGNDINCILKTLYKAKKMLNKSNPIAIILHTTMGNGVDYMLGKNEWHGKVPTYEQMISALNQNTQTTFKDYNI